jgi:hypothetical protein
MPVLFLCTKLHRRISGEPYKALEENIQIYLYIGLQHQLKQVIEDPPKMRGPNTILQQRKLLLQLGMRASHLLALQDPFRQDSHICHHMST